MQKLLTSLAIIVIGLSLAAPSAAATREEKRVRDATEALNQLLRIPEQSVPPSLLSRAYAVAVVPNVVKAAMAKASSLCARMTTPGATLPSLP